MRSVYMQSLAYVDANRIYSRIMELGEIGRTKQSGVQRLALSKEDKEAQILVTKWMEEAGLTVSHDHFGNLIGRKEGEKPHLPIVMIGSHIDSVRNGGKFDGIIGVLGGIEIAQFIYSNNISHAHTLEVIAFCEEEGSQFNDGLFGSRGMVGKATEEDFQKKNDQQVTRFDALKNFGSEIDPARYKESVRKEEEIKIYLEMHIEQGPYLDVNSHPVGIVNGIAGLSWYTIMIEGTPGHAGTVPMNLRNDPMIGAAKVIQEINEICSSQPDQQTVGTVGIIQAFPGGSNIIPNAVQFSLDLRDINLTRKNRIFAEIEERLQAICQENGLSYTIKTNIELDPVACSEEIIDVFTSIGKKLDMDIPIMVSGAGHDAMLMSEITDIGMIFVRCKKGISHQPEESATKEDIAMGTEIMLQAVLQYI
ncbi:hydantoinase/carbamoylase family amidase [Bacillus sp. UniB3]|uniref:Hydantoinase/carbamoylase family amidase n=2 Tax=Niallia alba TaxID=2729105 RepID=A0A7Y0PQC7_9BACI|nr:hydantoinase/carbamoylase family amidase [Niallia alba]